MRSSDLKRLFYITTLSGTAFCLPVSIWLLSLFTILTFISWILNGGFIKVKLLTGEKKEILIFFSIYLVYLIWMLNTSDTRTGFTELRLKLPLLLFPLVTGLSSPIEGKELRIIITSFISGVIVSSAYGVLTGADLVFSGNNPSIMGYAETDKPDPVSVVGRTFVLAEEEISKAPRHAVIRLGLPMGEFELMDLTGAVDIRSKGMRSAEAILKLYPEFEPWPALMSVHRYIVDKLWAPMSKKGLSGVKTGKGFYTYDGAKPRVPEELCGDMHPLEILAPGLNCAAWCVTNGVGSVDDINKIFRFAFNWPKGIFEYINDYGINEVVKILKRKQKEAPDKVKDFYAADPFLLNWDQQSG